MSSPPLAYDPDEGSRVVPALRRAWSVPFDAAIHRDDSMFRHAVDRRQGSRELALFEYFRSGREAADASLALLRARFGDDLAGRRFLELGCGFGRVTRFLRPRLVDADLLGAELEPGALEFQTSRFGLDGPIASESPDDLAEHRGRFDAVLAHSVLSHLPPRAFDAWSDALVFSLKPGGLLLFSVHSPDDRPLDVDAVEEGFAFVPASESTVLAGESYGTSWVAPERVRSALPPGVEHRVVPRGLWELQDLHVVGTGPLPEEPKDPETLLRRPRGVLDACRLEDTGRLLLEGWALGGDETSGPPRVEVRVDGETRWSGRPDAPRGDVTEPRGLGPSTLAGFRIEIRSSAGTLRSRSLLEVEVSDRTGSTIFHCGPVDSTTVWLRAAELEDRLRRTEVALRSWEEGRWGMLRRWARRWAGR